jgi:hypothetical protein
MFDDQHKGNNMPQNSPRCLLPNCRANSPRAFANDDDTNANITFTTCASRTTYTTPGAAWRILKTTGGVILLALPAPPALQPHLTSHSI